MKIMGRTLIILLAALVVTAGLLAFSSSSMAAGLRGLVQDVFQRATSVRGGVGGAAQSPSPAQRPAR